MAETATNRAYGWAVQTDFLTQKALAAGAFKQILVTDQNFLDYTPKITDNEDWAHGVNSATDQWIESHDGSVSHTMPGHSQEIGKVFYINGQYSVATPGGGTVSRTHTFKPTDPNVTRQDKALTYVERLGANWNALVPRMVSDGWTIKGDGLGILTVDFNLLSAGLVVPNAGVTFYPTGTPNVSPLTGLHKLFNTQVALVVTDGGTPTTYGCRYRSFEAKYTKSMLSDAGYKPGCADFAIAGTPTSGVIRSAHEFDKQMLEFTLTVDLAAGSAEFIAVQQQKPLVVRVTATGGIIEGAINHKLDLQIPVAYYRSTKLAINNGYGSFTISGKAFFDFATNKLWQIDLTNDVLTYATAF